MHSEDRKILDGRKIASARRSLVKRVKVVKTKDGTVKYNTGVIAQNLPQETADSVEKAMKNFLEQMDMYLKGEACKFLETALDNE